MQSKDLVGVWEAVDVKSTRVFVLDLRQQTYESYLSMVSAEAFLFSVHSVVVKGHHIELLGDGHGNAANLTLKLTGDGWAAAGEGQFDATITLRDVDGQKVYQTWRLPLFGVKGNLVKKLSAYKQLADQSIAAARSEFEKSLPVPAPGARTQ
jgi:hypothetical protein